MLGLTTCHPLLMCGMLGLTTCHALPMCVAFPPARCAVCGARHSTGPAPEGRLDAPRHHGQLSGWMNHTLEEESTENEIERLLKSGRHGGRGEGLVDSGASFYTRKRLSQTTGRMND